MDTTVDTRQSATTRGGSASIGDPPSLFAWLCIGYLAMILLMVFL